MSTNAKQGFNRIRFDSLLILISLIIASTLVNLFALLYIYTFKFIRDLNEVFEIKYQLPFILFEIIILTLMHLFTISSASRIYCKSDPIVIRSSLVRLVVIWSFLILFMFVVGIQFYLSSGEISTLLLDDYYKGYYDYGTNDGATNIVNKVSQQFECCGIENSTDWQTNQPYSPADQTEINSIPESCCKRAYEKCDRTDSNQINNRGCAKIIIEWSNDHIYLFLFLWLLLIVLSLVFCYLLKQIVNDIETEDDETVGGIKSMFLQNAECENLMNSRRRLKNYQDSFSKCTVGKQAVQIGFPALANGQDQLCSTTSMNSLNSNLGKLSRYSQIRYSKVKPSKQNDNGDENVELTCHQEEVNQDSSYDEDSSADSPTKANYTSSDSRTNSRMNSRADKARLKISNDKLNKLTSIKSTDRSVDKLSASIGESTKCIKEFQNDSFKSNPNYDPNYTSYKYNSNYDLIRKPESSSPSSSDDTHDDRNLIHPNDKHTYDKIKNKLTEIYLSNDSFISDRFDDVSTEYSNKGDCCAGSFQIGNKGLKIEHLPNGSHYSRCSKNWNKRSKNKYLCKNDSGGQSAEDYLRSKINRLSNVLNRSEICLDCKCKLSRSNDSVKRLYWMK